MISAIANGLSNSTLANIAQNTTASVSIETTLKSIGRPGFILIDNDISPATKKYAAAKEFLYQATCLAVYLTLITPVFKKGAFALAKKTFFKNKPEFAKFKNASEYLDYHNFASKNIVNRRASLAKDHSREKFKHDNLRNDLWKNKVPEKYPLIKGTIELGSLIGSVLGLAVLAPEISHHTIHPMLRALGMEKKEPKKQNIENHGQNLDKNV